MISEINQQSYNTTNLKLQRQHQSQNYCPRKKQIIVRAVTQQQLTQTKSKTQKSRKPKKKVQKTQKPKQKQQDQDIKQLNWNDLPDDDEELEKFAEYIQMTPQQKADYRQWRYNVTNEIKKSLKELKLKGDYQFKVFGSCAMNLATRESDLDFCIITRKQNDRLVNRRSQQINLYHQVRKNLIDKYRLKLSCVVVVRARVPIIQIKYKGMQIDLSTSRLEEIKQRIDISKVYQSEFKNFRTIYLVIHYLMIKSGLGCNADGGIGGWALQQMIFVALRAYYQHYQQIVEEDNLCMNQLVWFLSFYLNQFDAKCEAVDSDSSSIVNLQHLNVGKIKSSVVILDPILKKNMVMRGKWSKVRSLFQALLDCKKQIVECDISALQ
eukprot:TRINITY_DN14882_c0_g2_i2.p1 TRINITY_DN14882_c0_g2~~TRINITY_DN14882_c0_g2_i2.p1  ORF type:complete len:380 (-),score=21.86 TRINITY_DN14882_c0_g2_i2:42-1181(-)